MCLGGPQQGLIFGPVRIALKILCEFLPKICLIDSEGGNSKWPVGTTLSGEGQEVRPASVSVRLPAIPLQETSPHAKGEQLRMCCLSG